jgi:hypothetical protein
LVHEYFVEEIRRGAGSRVIRDHVVDVRVEPVFVQTQTFGHTLDGDSGRVHIREIPSVEVTIIYFRSDVVSGPVGAIVRPVHVGESGESEVTEHHCSVLENDQIVWLDVHVDHPVMVHKPHRPEEGGCDSFEYGRGIVIRDYHAIIEEIDEVTGPSPEHRVPDVPLGGTMAHDLDVLHGEQHGILTPHVLADVHVAVMSREVVEDFKLIDEKLLHIVDVIKGRIDFVGDLDDDVGLIKGGPNRGKSSFSHERREVDVDHFEALGGGDWERWGEAQKNKIKNRGSKFQDITSATPLTPFP